MMNSPKQWIALGGIAYVLLIASDLGAELPGAREVRCQGGPVIVSTHTPEEREEFCRDK
ncbi:hypothetical protein ACIQAC_37540 [Streptomyces sp. NPDC088387]|uniref:hypothetical protein n=1 Tax=Streptomyces sp. NPDC088387 TaxID=3365859 RepID=UPI003826E2E2